MRISGEVAESGWVIEVILTMANDRPESRFFAVGVALAAEAEEAVLCFPGLLPEDQRIARRRLAPAEFARLELRTGAVRPFRGDVDTNEGCDSPPRAVSRALETQHR